MEEKKKILVEILEQLEGYRDMAPGFLVILKKTNNEKIINNLLNLIQKGVKLIKSRRIRSKIMNKIKKIQEEKDFDQEKDIQEVDFLLNDFMNKVND